jgi:hypothetical protein
MRKALGIGIGATAVAALAMGGISVASASAPVRGDWAAVTAPTSKTSTATGVNVAEARRLAEAAVPGGYGVQIESDDLADRPVWKVTVDGPAGRVTVLVDVASGAATVANRPADSSARRTSAASRSAAPPPAGSADDHRASAGSDDRASTSGDRRGRHGRHGHDDPAGHR